MTEILTAEGLFVVDGTTASVDWGKAVLDASLSSIGYDDQTESFWATHDHLQNKSLVETVSTVLLTNGFVDNLENMLASADQVRFGCLTRSKRPSLDSPLQVKRYNHCLILSMPQKSKVGAFLRKFYDEVETYEAELTRLKTPAGAKKEDKEQAKLEKRIAELQKQNVALQENVSQLASRLQHLQQSHAIATKAIQSGHLLPEGIRIGTIKGIDLPGRNCIIRVNRTNFSAPLHILERIPAIEAKCLIYMIDGRVDGLLVQGVGEISQETRVATVIAMDGDQIKLRDQKRQEWLFKPKHSSEEKLVMGLRRRSVVVIRIVDGFIISLVPVAAYSSRSLIHKVTEDIILQQLGTTYLEALSDHQGESISEDVA